MDKLALPCQQEKQEKKIVTALCSLKPVSSSTSRTFSENYEGIKAMTEENGEQLQLVTEAYNMGVDVADTYWSVCWETIFKKQGRAGRQDGLQQQLFCSTIHNHNYISTLLPKQMINLFDWLIDYFLQWLIH